MEKTLRTDQVGVWGRLSVIVVIFIIGFIWMDAGRIDKAMAQAGAPSAATGNQAQTPAAAPAATAETKEAEVYLVGRWGAFTIAIGFLVVVLLLTLLVKSENGFNFFQSPDGAVSVSKVQVWMWTMTLIFSYVYLFLWHGPPEKFPDSLWELMGISALSTGTARYIATVTGKTQPPTDEAKATIAKQNWLVSMLSDDGQPSMMRLQMFGWTLVTVFLFLMYLHKNQTLWDVPNTLVILMGISHAGYLGDKGAAAAKPN
jgi:hypothetical protein